ncbi:MAG: ABC transporter ATP-binding protein [Candidatus Marinimicrobia bacterium]|jgi:ABC-2 type transport system ATP-binding protein|nr:ABC transporter ATP-binding protein [Candidatus Neomarinimicrobiota bacterium]MBT3763543.1 ABC transporter ATP-binding protein [Candidatus Neomarinimicrobiota bacterium]MBT4067568.1 ABC transporter ATP-binding protein [Candidatus Neomarinimicrobiota bacterium]MBT4372715.1 ABC transporter ATP-binding protein [Candidatus Neomarinimicrobiota bacterium]MBT4809464.1 ABC transporter ATP-binding protein [Candidatus Neomarinimicrobiota bacterium]
MEASITLKKVGKLAGDKTVLAGLTFGVERGSLVAVIGDNEAGKSMLLKVISGIEYQEFGQVYINGLDSRTRRLEVMSSIGFVPHEIDLDPWLTLEQNIRFMGMLYSIDVETVNTRMVQLARELHIIPYLKRMVQDISPGIVKKGMVLRALIHDPEILIMDEPTAFMDAESYRHTWDLLLRFKGVKTIVYVSQSLQEVEAAHDRILVLEDGRIALDGSLDKLLGSTFEFHQFQIEFEELPENLFQQLSKLPKVKNPSRIGNSIHFYGRERNIFFEVLNAATSAVMKDISVKKLGLQDLMDAKFAKDGIH